jgi:hypothetical protein
MYVVSRIVCKMIMIACSDDWYFLRLHTFMMIYIELDRHWLFCKKPLYYEFVYMYLQAFAFCSIKLFYSILYGATQYSCVTWCTRWYTLIIRSMFVGLFQFVKCSIAAFFTFVNFVLPFYLSRITPKLQSRLFSIYKSTCIYLSIE